MRTLADSLTKMNPKVEIPVVWTAVLLAWFKAVPWAEIAACLAAIYTLIRIAQTLGWIKTRGQDG